MAKKSAPKVSKGAKKVTKDTVPQVPAHEKKTKKVDIEPFLYDLVLTADESETIADYNDDFTRDPIIHRRVQAAARQAHERILAAGIAFFRPPGYSVERVKTEEQMDRIRKKRDEDQENQKSLERIRKERENKRFAKKVAAEAKVAKQKQASEQKKELEAARKGKKSLLGNVGKDEFEVDVEDNEPSYDADDRKPSRGKPGAKRVQKSVSGKRKAKNEKYGFGGKKRGKKENTRESTNDDSSFSVRKNKSTFKGQKGGRKAKPSRPGKQRRHNIRSSKASRK